MKQQDIEEFLSGSFDLDCPKIELLPSDKSPNKSLVGAGHIKINEDGNFHLKVYFSEKFSIGDVFERLNWESGKVIGEGAYYDLIAYDMSGNRWQAERFIPEKAVGQQGQ